MAISIDWQTYVIYVPQSYLIPVGGTIYELDTEQFRLDLKAIEASVYGMGHPKTHNHNTTVTVAGTTYARAIEILFPYSVEFEDGQYTVILKGSNNNIFDVSNGILVQNQVQIISTNAAGLIVTNIGSGVTEQDKLDIADRVWDELVAQHSILGTFGNELVVVDDLSSITITGITASVDVNAIADAVWNEPVVDHVTLGTFGSELATSTDLSTLIDLNAIASAVWNSLTTNYITPNTLGHDIAKKIDLDSLTTEKSYLISGVGDLVVNLGSVVSGTYLDTQTHDEQYLVLGETLTGFSYDFKFVVNDSQEIPRLLQFQGRYQGNPAHEVDVYAYNDETSSFEFITTETGSYILQHSTADYFKEFILSRDHINPITNQVMIRIVHTSPGTVSHRIYIDKINIVTANVALSLTEAGIASAVWNSVLTNYTTSGIFGTELITNNDIDNIASEVWSSLTGDYTTPGILGYDISKKSDLNNITISGIAAADIDEIITKVDANQILLQFISDLESGKQVLVGNQLICYKPDNVTELIRFNLFDAGGSPTTDNVYRRDRT